MTERKGDPIWVLICLIIFVLGAETSGDRGVGIMLLILFVILPLVWFFGGAIRDIFKDFFKM